VIPLCVRLLRATLGGTRDAFVVRAERDRELMNYKHVSFFSAEPGDDADAILDASGNVKSAGDTARPVIFPCLVPCNHCQAGKTRCVLSPKLTPAGAFFRTFLGRLNDEQGWGAFGWIPRKNCMWMAAPSPPPFSRISPWPIPSGQEWRKNPPPPPPLPPPPPPRMASSQRL